MTDTRRAWLVIASGEDRQYGGNDGYTDEPDAFYSWDSTVANHAQIHVGDYLVIWNKNELIGYSVVEQIEQAPDVKMLHRCPSCDKSRIKPRTTMSPKYKCQECSEVFDSPRTEVRDVTTYRSRHDAAWVHAFGSLNASELRSLCVSPRSQLSMRALDWSAFRSALRSKGVFAGGVDVDARSDAAHGGHSSTLTRVRIGQGKFRKDTLSHFGELCALSGRTPAAALEAAHLYSFAAVGAHADQGGVLLRRDLHTLFDRGDIAIEPASQLIDVRDPVRAYPAYKALHGAALHVTLNSKQWAWVRQHWSQHR